MIILVSVGGGEVCNSAFCMPSGLSVFQVQRWRYSSLAGGKFRIGQGGEAPGRTALNFLALNSFQLLGKENAETEICEIIAKT